MITAVDTTGKTINDRSDPLQNAKVIFALLEAKKIDTLKFFKDHFKASVTVSFAGSHIKPYWNLRTSMSSGPDFVFSSPEGSWIGETKITADFNKIYFNKIYETINSALVNRLFSERLTTTYIAYRPEVEWLMPKESPITALLSDLRDLMKEGGEDEEDEYGVLRPTGYAFRTALNLIIEASFLLIDGYPFGCASTDSEGGIRIEWFKTTGEIRLVIPASKEKEPYIYYEFGEKYGVDRQANADKLARWINRLTNI
jgi:hypothetical protein